MDAINDGSNDVIKTEEDLRKIYKAPSKGAVTKETDYITEPGKALIAASPMIMMATCGGDGCDVSPKGDAPGFVQVLDEHTLLIPDRPGNNRLDGISNLIENPKIGLIFIVPGSDTTYRVNGSAFISKDPTLLERFLVNGKPPLTIVVVKVEEAYSHCPKAFVRSKLWAEGAKGEPVGVPTPGAFAAHRDGGDAGYAEKFDAEVKKRMPGELY